MTAQEDIVLRFFEALDALVLMRQLRGVATFARRYGIDRRTPTREEASACVMEAAGRETPQQDTACDLFAAFDKFTASCGRDNSWTAATFRKFATLRRHLWLYDQRLRLNTLTDSRMAGFVAYLTAKGYRNSYTAKLCGFLRWFLRWAAGADLYDGHLHQTWRPRLKGATARATRSERKQRKRRHRH